METIFGFAGIRPLEHLGRHARVVIAVSLWGWKPDLKVRSPTEHAMILRTLTITLAAFAGLAQSQAPAAATPQFEVASVKPAAPLGTMQLPIRRGGPGTGDPARIFYSPITAMQLITQAYGVYGDQVIGPGWLISEYYTVAANVPAGATKEQFALMLQNLLVERFKLAFHRDTKEFTVYELTVANGGAKLTPAAGDGAEEAEGAGGVEPQVFVPVSPALGKDGCPALRPGIHAAVGANDCTTFRKYSISDVVVNLGMRIALENGDMYGPQASAAHVTDKTGLSGEFDFTLKNAFHPRIPGIAGASPLGQPSEPAGGQSLSAALEKQLGLKLSKTKAKLDVLVIDHLEKIPTGN